MEVNMKKSTEIVTKEYSAKVLPSVMGSHLLPLDTVEGYKVRPGFYEINGATAIPGGISFTVHSQLYPVNCCSTIPKNALLMQF